MINKFLFILIVTFHLGVQAQEDTDPFKNEIDSLILLGNSIPSGEIIDRVNKSNHFKRNLHRIIKQTSSIGYDFSKVKNLSVITGPKNKFRVFTWLIKFDDGTYEYFGFTQYVKGKKKKQSLVITELENNAASVKKNEFKKLKPTQWMGAVYYEIVEPKSKRDKNYILLGWDGNNNRSSKKIVESISFNYKGIPTFGAPIFKVIDEFSKNKRIVTKSRIVFEFSAKTTISLRYNKDLKMIVFDHVAPTNDRLKSMKFTYVPDFSFDGLQYKKKVWIHVPDVDARMKDIVEPVKYDPKDYHTKDSTTTKPTN